MLPGVGYWRVLDFGRQQSWHWPCPRRLIRRIHTFVYGQSRRSPNPVMPRYSSANSQYIDDWPHSRQGICFHPSLHQNVFNRPWASSFRTSTKRCLAVFHCSFIHEISFFVLLGHFWTRCCRIDLYRHHFYILTLYDELNIWRHNNVEIHISIMTSTHDAMISTHYIISPLIDAIAIRCGFRTYCLLEPDTG